MKLEKMHYFGIGFGLLVGVAGGIILREFIWFILVLSLVIIFSPFIVSMITSQQKQREKEEQFLSFARDLVENVKSGTPISKSIINLRNRDYGPLSFHIQKIASQLNLGITLSEALENFGRDSKSSVISRAVRLISEAERAGGRIETILEAVSASVNQIENLKKERKAAIANLVTQGYIIFLVFIVIMLVLEFKILPLVSDLAVPQGLSLNATAQVNSSVNFSTPLFIMLLVQSFFAGLVIGKISEGSIRSGFKHSFILLALTLIVTTGARAFFG